MGWIAAGFETPALGDATLPTYFFPLVLLGFIIFCVIIYTLEYLIAGQSGGDGAELVYTDGAYAKRGLLTLATACVSYVIWVVFGFIAAGLFAAPAIALAMGVRRLSHLMVILTSAGIIFLVFTYGLGTQFK